MHGETCDNSRYRIHTISLACGQKCRCWSVINFLEFNKHIKNIAHTSEFMSKITSVSQDTSYVRDQKHGHYVTEYHQLSLNGFCTKPIEEQVWRSHVKFCYLAKIINNLKEFVNKLLSKFNCVLLIFMYIKKTSWLDRLLQVCAICLSGQMSDNDYKMGDEHPCLHPFQLTFNHCFHVWFKIRSHPCDTWYCTVGVDWEPEFGSSLHLPGLFGSFYKFWSLSFKYSHKMHYYIPSYIIISACNNHELYEQQAWINCMKWTQIIRYNAVAS